MLTHSYVINWFCQERAYFWPIIHTAFENYLPKRREEIRITLFLKKEEKKRKRSGRASYNHENYFRSLECSELTGIWIRFTFFLMVQLNFVYASRFCCSSSYFWCLRHSFKCSYMKRGAEIWGTKLSYRHLQRKDGPFFFSSPRLFNLLLFVTEKHTYVSIKISSCSSTYCLVMSQSYINLQGMSRDRTCVPFQVRPPQI